MKVHMTAIGGTGMGAVAGLLTQNGHTVRGSDGPIYPPMSTQLAKLGIDITEGYAAKNLDWGPDLVVVGNTCKADHVELVAAQQRGLRIVSFPQLVGELFLAKRHAIVVSGTHGKTTTSSLIAWLLAHAGANPGYLIGGVPANLTCGYAVGEAPYFVVEGDEYDSACFDKRPKFVHYAPSTAILTGVEFDHADIFGDLDALKRSFSMLVDAMPEHGRLLVSAESLTAIKLARDAKCAVETYAVSPVDDEDAAETRRLAMPLAWHGTYERLEGPAQRLTVRRSGEKLAAFNIPMTGAHNMSNALAAIAVAVRLGISTDTIAAGLLAFEGVARRQQVRGVQNGVTVIDDFAHHPTAIRETLRGLRDAHGHGQLIAIYEPRSGTSRRNTFQLELPDALSEADHVFVAPLYAPEKVPAGERLNLDRVLTDLRSNYNTPALTADVATIVAETKDLARRGDTVVVMSCGGFDGIHDKLLTALKS